MPVGHPGHHQAQAQPLGASGQEAQGGVALEHRLATVGELLHLEVVVHEGERRAPRAPRPRAPCPTGSGRWRPGPPGRVKLAKWMPSSMGAPHWTSRAADRRPPDQRRSAPRVRRPATARVRRPSCVRRPLEHGQDLVAPPFEPDRAHATATAELGQRPGVPLGDARRAPCRSGRRRPGRRPCGPPTTATTATPPPRRRPAGGRRGRPGDVGADRLRLRAATRPWDRRVAAATAWVALPSSSARNARRRVPVAPAPPPGCRPGSSATWKTRRSPSTSSLSRWGNRPAEAPTTRTCPHSFPLIRWTVESSTPGPEDAGGRLSTSRSQWANVAASGWNAATDSRAARSSAWVERSAPAREASRVSRVASSPIPTRMASRASAVERAVAAATTSRSSA